MRAVKVKKDDHDNIYSIKPIVNTQCCISELDKSVNNTVITMANTACNKRGKVRRKRNNVKPMTRHCADHLKIFSTNAAGLIKGKLDSLKAEVLNTECNIITVQETHCRKKGKLTFPNFVTFEAIRTKQGGGTMISAHEDLKPKLISEYSDEFEILVVEVETVEKSVRIISGYGPQENLEEEKRLPFFVALEKEIEKAELAGKSIVIEMDANSKLGPKYIAKDPHEMTPNGLILSRVIDRHALCVANGLKKSVGTITRKRVTRYRTEESVIDIVLISHDMKQLLVSFKVDEDKKHVLTRITKGKHGVNVKESDHNVIQTEFKCRVNNAKKKHKNEIYNLKNKDNQKKFKQYTSQNNFLSSVFEGDDDLDKMT